MNSRAKGARGERELAKVLRDNGFPDARRGQQYSGIHGDADIVDALDGIHIECKRVERLNVSEAMAQSKRDSGELVPIVAHRKNGEQWLVTMELVNWLELYKAWKGAKNEA